MTITKAQNAKHQVGLLNLAEGDYKRAEMCFRNGLSQSPFRVGESHYTSVACPNPYTVYPNPYSALGSHTPQHRHSVCVDTLSVTLCLCGLPHPLQGYPAP